MVRWTVVFRRQYMKKYMKKYRKKQSAELRRLRRKARGRGSR